MKNDLLQIILSSFLPPEVHMKLWNTPKNVIKAFDTFHITDFFLYPLKRSEKEVFWRFQGYKKRPMTWNGLTEN